MRSFLPVIFAAMAPAAMVNFYQDADCEGTVGPDYGLYRCESGCQNTEIGEGSVLATISEPNQRLVVYDQPDCTGNSQDAAQCCGADAIASGSGSVCLTPPSDFDSQTWKSFQYVRIESVAGGGEACPCLNPGCPPDVPTE